MLGYHKKLFAVELSNRKIDVENLDGQTIQYGWQTHKRFLPNRYQHLFLAPKGTGLLTSLHPRIGSK